MQRWLRIATSAALALAGCAAPAAAPVVPTTPVGHVAFAIDPVKAVEALGNRPNVLWQDPSFNTRAVRERRATSPYKLQTSTAANSWPGTVTLPSASTNGVAYAHIDTTFRDDDDPHAGDVLFAVCDNGTVVRMDPANNGAFITPNFSAFTGITGAGTVSKSAVSLSGTNTRIYLLTTGGWFIVLNAGTGALQCAVRLSSSGFANIAPFIDYSNGGGGSDFNDEDVYALAADGSLYRVNVKPTGLTVRAWRAQGGTDAGAAASLFPANGAAKVGPLAAANGGLATVNYGGAVTIKAPPIVWAGEAVYGATNGRLYRLRTGANALDSLAVSAWPIETTPAVEYNASFTAINDVFVPGGDRLHWVDASDAGSLRHKGISPPLVLNTKPSSGLLGASGILSLYSYNGATTPLSFAATDWVTAATAAPAAGQGPSRWGGEATELGSYNTGSNPYALMRDPTTGNVWVTTPGDNRIREFDYHDGTAGEVYDGSGNYAALVKTIPVGVGSQPTFVTDDPLEGGAWVACYGTNELRQLDSAGNLKRTLTNVPSPTAICYDTRGTAGVNDDWLWVTSATGTGANPTGALLRINVSNGAMSSFTNANATDGTMKRYTNDATNQNVNSNPARTNLNQNSWRLRGPQGVAKDSQGRIWVANSFENMDPNQCNFCPSAGLTAGYPFNVDGHSDPSYAAQAQSSILVFDPTSSTFKAQIMCTGAPFNMEPYGDSMWCATYRWGVDTTSRFRVTANINANDAFLKLYESWQNTGEHWQPHWVAVDEPRNQVWIVNGDANTKFLANETAAAGLDRLRADAELRNTNPNANNAGMNTNNPRYLGTYETGAQPRGAAIDSNGNVWVANASAKSCTKYSSTGGALGTYPVGTTPWCVACDKDDVTWVCNRTDGTVSRITAATQPPAPLSQPRGAAVDANGNYWIANAGDDSMTVLNTTGNTVFPKQTMDPNADPYGVVSMGAAGIWVNSTGQNEISRFNLSTAGRNDTTPNPNNRPFWSVVNAAGSLVYTSIPASDRVAIATTGGAFSGTLTTGDEPRGLAIDPPTSDLWVANRAGNSVTRFPAATAVGTQTLTGLNGPEGVAVGGNQAWIANTGGNSVVRLNAKGGVGRAAIGTSLGTITGYAGANRPTHALIDAQENLWVTNVNTPRLTKFWFAGQQDMVAANSYRSGDGNDSYGYLRFAIAPNAFGGRTPRGARVQLTAKTSSALAAETLRTYLAAETLANGTPWTGFAGTPNVDWNQSPALGAAEGLTATAVTAGNNYQVPVNRNTHIIDAANTASHPSNGLVSYAFQSTTASLGDAAHWSAQTGTKPQLVVDVLASKLNGAGLRSQPTVEGETQRIWVMGSNAIFELRYDSVANFEDPSKIAFSYTRQGIAKGPTSNATDYITPTGASTLTYSGRLVTADFDPASNTTTMNSFKLGNLDMLGFFLNTSGNNTIQLDKTRDVTGPISNSQICYDFGQGSVYVVSGTTVTAVRLLQ